MRVAASHDLAPVLENLDVTNIALSSEMRELLHPGVDDSANICHGHASQREIVSRRKADDTANSALRPGHQQTASIDFYDRFGWP